MELAPHEVHRRSTTPAAQAKREQRRRARGRDPRLTCDPLAERERLVKLWKSSPWYASRAASPKQCWWRPFIVQLGFRHLLMPGVRAHIDARAKAFKERLRAEAADYDRRCQERKVLREVQNGKPAATPDELKRAARNRARNPQQQLFE